MIPAPFVGGWHVIATIQTTLRIVTATMLFNIDRDDGHRVIAWLVPDRPDEVPRLRVSLSDCHSPSVVVAANHQRDDLKLAGLHESGMCGFVIDASIVPNIEALPQLAIRELETDILIYRRGGALGRYVAGLHFRLETSILPRARLDRLLASHFLMSFPNLELYPAQTVRSVLGIKYSTSTTASGRVPLFAVSDLLQQQHYRISALLGDPYREILARVLLIKQAADDEPKLSSIAPRPVLARIRSSLRTIDGRDLEAIDKSLRKLDREALHYLSDPLTRQLVEATPGQSLPRAAAQEAMRQLSRLDAIGVESDPGEYIDLLGALFGTVFGLNGDLGTGPESENSAQLRNLPSFRQLARFDGPLFDTLVDAIAELPEPAEQDSGAPPLISFAARRAIKAPDGTLGSSGRPAK